MFYVLFIAIGLAMDSFCASIALASSKKKTASVGLLSSFMFGLFQGLMPLIGWIIGETFKSYISGVDHWIAFLMLAGLGLKMIIDELKGGEEEFEPKKITFKLILSLAFATSIDALIVGMGLSLIDMPVAIVVSTIGLVTFALSWIGCHLGSKCSGFLESKAGLLGGLILVGIGIKILVDHLFF